MVWSYAVKHNVPYNPLHDQNYPRSDARIAPEPFFPGRVRGPGRWAGSEKTECGLHVAAPAAIAPLVEIKVKTAIGYEES